MEDLSHTIRVNAHQMLWLRLGSDMFYSLIKGWKAKNGYARVCGKKKTECKHVSLTI